MSTKVKAIYVLTLNLPIAASIAATAMILSVGQFIPQLFALNLTLAYILAFFIGMFIPCEKIGVGFAKKFKVKPGIGFGALINVAINFIYVLILCVAMSFFNVVILNGAPVIAAVFAFLSLFVPIYIVGYIVSFVFNEPCRKFALKFSEEPVVEK